MSLLINQNWLGLDGTSVTGRVPTRIVMMEGALTPAQYAQVAHAYQMFCMGKTTAVGDYFVASRILADGTRVRCETLQGKDRVLVWAKDTPSQEVFPPHGIGVVFTDLSDAPVAPYTRDKRGGPGLEPQPLILVPGARKVGNEIVSDGKWKILKADRIVGGQRLWVNKKRTKWMSMFGWFADIFAAYYSLGPAEPDLLITLARRKGWSPDTTWTPASFSRIITDAGKRYGKYVMRSNEAFGLTTVPSVTPPFLAMLKNSEGVVVPHIAHMMVQGGIIYFGKEPYDLKMGADPDRFAPVVSQTVDPAPAANITPVGLFSIPDIAGFTPMPGTVTVHPDGTRAFVMVDPESTVGKKNDGSYAEITIGDTVAGQRKIDPQFDVSLPVVTGSGGYNESLVIAPYTAPYVDSHGLTLIRQDGYSTDYIYDGASRAEYQRLNRAPVRIYFSLGGKEEFERVEESSSAVATNSSQVTRSGATRGEVNYPFPGSPGGISDGATTTTTRNYTTMNFARTLLLRGRRFDLVNTKYVAGGGLDSAVSIVAGVSTQGAFNEYRDEDAHVTERVVLHWDAETNFIVYVEYEARHISHSAKSSPDGAPSIAETDTATFKLKAEHRGQLVLDELVATLPAPKAFYTGALNTPGSGTASSVDAGSIPVTLTQAVWSGSAWVPENYTATCWGGKTDTASVTYEYNDGVIFLLPRIVAADGVKDLAQYCDIRSARDPVTLASLVNLTFHGGEYGSGQTYKSWFWAVDHVSAKNLKDVLKISSDIEVSQTASLNSLVSI